MAFVKIGEASDIANNEGRLFIINGERIAVFNVGGKFYAIQDTCPHRGASLAEGHIDGKTVTCGLHGWQFDLESGNHLFLPAKVKKYSMKAEGESLLIDI